MQKSLVVNADTTIFNIKFIIMNNLITMYLTNIYLEMFLMGDIMEYCEFIESVRSQVMDKVGVNTKVVVNHVYKNNGRELDGMVIMEEGRSVAPTIYLNDYYKAYTMGETIEDIVGHIYGIYDTHKDNLIGLDVNIFNEFKNIKDRVVYKLVNYEKNKMLLKKVPYKKVLDLAVLYCYLLDTEDGVKASALIHNEHIERWGVDISELHEAAVINTPKLLPAIITPMTTIIDDIMMARCGECAETTFTINDVVKVVKAEECGILNPMYVLTNENKYQGAGCILYDGVLQEFAQYMNSDMYILPSSIHEVIILLKNQEYNKDSLKKMVREVNSEGVELDDILSDNVYEYNRNDGFIRL